MATELSVSVGLSPQAQIVDLARTAEQLGYARLWLTESPALFGDVWIALARVGEATRRIGLGTAVAVPSLRHPMGTAAAIASIEQLAAGRLTVALGTGFTARRTMGQRPMRWADLARYFQQLRGLLRGEVVDIDGAVCQMLHTANFAPRRPIDVPLWLAPSGPKGFATARELGADGVVLTGVPTGFVSSWDHVALRVAGTVLREGETHRTPRVVDAVGPVYASMLHGLAEVDPARLDEIPGGRAWREAMVDAGRPRHLLAHEGHADSVTERDRLALAEAGDHLLSIGWTGDAASIRSRLDHARRSGVTEVIFRPAGPDAVGEMQAFIAAAHSS